MTESDDLRFYAAAAEGSRQRYGMEILHPIIDMLREV